MKYLLLLSALLILEHPVAWAQDSSAVKKKKMIANTRFTTLVDMRTSFEFESSEIQKLELFLRPDLEVPLHKNFRIRMIGRLYTEFLDELEPGEPGQMAISAMSKRVLLGELAEIELRELYFDWKIKKHYLTLGKQQIVWGKSDGLKILDVLNPTNFREFLLDDFDNSRIPLWSMKMDLNLSKVKAQFVWIPDLSYHDFPAPNSSFYPSALIPPQTDEITVSTAPLQKPDQLLEDSDVGLRLSAFVKGWDLSANYFYSYDDSPIARTYARTDSSGVQSILIEPMYARTHLVGTSFSNSFKAFTIRGEVAWSIDRAFASTDPSADGGLVRSDQLMVVAGLDYSGFSNITLSMQVFEDHVFYAGTTVGRDRSETNLSFLAKRSYLNELLNIEVIYIQNLNRGDGFVRPGISYQLSNTLSSRLGADIFFGDESRTFGQFKTRNRLSLTLQIGL